MNNSLSWALTQVELGNKVARKSWDNEWFTKGVGGVVKSKDLWNKHAREFAEALPNQEIEVASYLLFKTNDNKLVMGWLPSQEDVFAEDYIIVLQR